MGRTSRTRKRKQERRPSLNLSSNMQFIQLTRWMSNHNWSPICQLCPVNFNHTGRGLMTKRHIASGDTLVHIPLELLITVSTVDKSTLACVFHSCKKLKFFAQQVLATYLVWEKHKHSNSHWYPYLNSLPLKFTLPIFCSLDELKTLPPFIAESISLHKRKLLDSFASVSAIFSNFWFCNSCKRDCKDVFSTFSVEYEDYVWAWSVVNTRSVYLELPINSNISFTMEDRGCLALAPYLDMFNHSNDAKVQVGLNTDGKTYDICSLVPFPKHSQVFIYYGPHSNLHLYVEYGFIIPTNPHDAIFFTYQDVTHAIEMVYCVECSCSSWKYKFLKSHNLCKDLMCNAEGLSFNLKALIYVLVSPDAEKKHFQQKIYSNSFEGNDKIAINNVGQFLIEMKFIELTTALAHMMEITDPCSESFEVAKCLVKEYINVLHKSEISLTEI